jgi:hypothetical protein
MPESDIIDELMLRWEAARQHGAAPRPEELCAEHPQLTTELRQRILAVETMERVLGVDQLHSDPTEKPKSPSAAPQPAVSAEERGWG